MIQQRIGPGDGTRVAVDGRISSLLSVFPSLVSPSTIRPGTHFFYFHSCGYNLQHERTSFSIIFCLYDVLSFTFLYLLIVFPLFYTSSTWLSFHPHFSFIPVLSCISLCFFFNLFFLLLLQLSSSSILTASTTAQPSPTSVSSSICCFFLPIFIFFTFKVVVGALAICSPQNFKIENPSFAKEWKERETASNGRTVPLGVNQKRRVGNSQTGHRM